jgi:hypothetical protein
MLAIVSLALLAANPPNPTPAWTPKDKEMVVLLGSTFIEQEASGGSHYISELSQQKVIPSKPVNGRHG